MHILVASESRFRLRCRIRMPTNSKRLEIQSSTAPLYTISVGPVLATTMKAIINMTIHNHGYPTRQHVHQI
jgi:hypothetical protein